MYINVFTYLQDDILRIHGDIVCCLVFHEENKLTSFVLDNAKLLVDLSIS